MTGPKYSSPPPTPQKPHEQDHEFRPASLDGAEASRQTALLMTTADGIIYLFWNTRKCLQVTPLQVSRREEEEKALKSSAGRTEITTPACTSTAQTAVKLKLTSTISLFLRTWCTNSLFQYIYYTPLHVSSTIMLIFRRTIVLVQHLASPLSLGDSSDHRLREDKIKNLCTKLVKKTIIILGCTFNKI